VGALSHTDFVIAAVLKLGSVLLWSLRWASEWSEALLRPAYYGNLFRKPRRYFAGATTTTTTTTTNNNKHRT
jgi:hypothetical protein